MTIADLKPHPKTSKIVIGQGYDSPLRILYILFNTKIVYAYHDITDKVYDKFMKAESSGKFLHKEIIPNHYAEKVTLSEK